MNENLNFRVVMRFYEPPNFSMCSDGDEVVLARVNSRVAAEAFVKAYALEYIKSLGEVNVRHVNDLTADDIWSVTYNVGDTYLGVLYGFDENMVVCANFKIEAICPECGCIPQDKPFHMEATHCPKCGHVFDLEE